MAKLEVSGVTAHNVETAAFIGSFDNVLDEMLNAEAEVVERAQKTKGEAYGVHKKTNGGMTLKSIKRGKIHKHNGDRWIEVAPQGKNARGNRNAEVAFLNEYGVPRTGLTKKTKKGKVQRKATPARPFIRDANEECADEAVQKAYKVYDDYLKKKGL